MNTEKLEKLKKSLDNKFIPDNMKDKIRAEIKKLEADIKTDETITATEVKEEVKEIEKKVEKALEVAEEKEEKAEAKKEEAEEIAEAKADEKKAKKSRTKTQKSEDKPKSAKKSVFSIAKEIRKDGETWEEAKDRARKMMKSETTETKKKTKTETQKLLAMVRRNKEYKKLTGSSDLPKDAQRRALPRGKRVSSNGNVYYENRANRVDVGGFKNAYLENGGYANKGVYVETLDEEIDLTDDGKPRVIKTQQGGDKSFGERREMHGASPEALAFDNGGKVGRYSILGEVDGEQPVLYATTDDKERIKPLVNMAEIDLYELTGKKHRIFVTDEVTDNEVYHYGNGGRTRERRYVNHSQDYEVRYSKDKPHRRGYGYAGGGVVLDNIKIEVYKSFHGLKAENYFDDVNGYDWNVVTMKRHTGELVSSARGGKANKSEGNVEFFTFDYNSPNIKLISSRPSRVTEKVIEIQHSQALQLFKEKMEEGNFADGGTIIGTPETPLARGLDIDYTGLVGETGGMSAGEMFAMGGSLGNHGLKQGDQIIKTMSGGVQKVKTKSGDIVYVNLANGYRGAEPPLPFAKGGYTNERRHVNKAQDYEVRYAKNKPNRTGYLGKRSFDDGGFMTDPNFGDFQNQVYAEKGAKVDNQFNYMMLSRLQMDCDYYLGHGNRNEKVLWAGNVDDHIAEMKKLWNNLPKNGKPEWLTMEDILDYEKKMKSDNYSNGGVTKNYINRNQLNTITIKKGNQKLTYKVSDVYNGAYKLEDGGNLEKTAFYVSKRNVVKVQLKNGKDVKVTNGYWIKKGAKPIHTSKYDDGGEMEYANGGEFGKVAFEISNDYVGNLFLGFYDVKINEEFNSSNSFMKYSDAVESLMEYLQSEDGIFVAKEYPKSKFEIVMVSYNSKLDKFKDLEPQRKTILSVKASMIKDFTEKRIFEDGGQLEMKFLKGGKLESKIQKKVDEVNSLIEKAIDKDGDPIMVVDKSGTWEEPMQYKPIVYKNGRLYFEYYEPYSGKTQKEVVNKSNIEFDGYPMLLDIAKMYRRALKEKGVSFAGGGKTTFKEKATAIAKKFEGKKVEPKYQKEYGKTYDKAEAKEVGNKIAGSQKAKYDAKMSGGGSTKRGGAMQLAKEIRKEGESWASALKRANEQIRNQK